MIMLGYSRKKVTEVSAEVLISTNKKTEWKTPTNENKVCRSSVHQGWQRWEWVSS